GRGLRGGRGAKRRVRRLPNRGWHQPALQVQDPRALVCPFAGDGLLEPWAHAGRHHGDPRLARYCIRGNRPVINLSGPIRDESLTPDAAKNDCRRGLKISRPSTGRPEIVIFTCRMLHFSRAAICSTLVTVPANDLIKPTPTARNRRDERGVIRSLPAPTRKGQNRSLQ